MTIPEQAASIINNVLSGLRGITNDCPISQEQVEEEAVLERNQIIKEYLSKQIIQPSAVAQTLDSVKTDDMSLSTTLNTDQLLKHVEIPKLFMDLQRSTMLYIGSSDKYDPYMVYFDESFSYHKYRIRGSKMPYVYINPTPNANDAIDVFIFNDEPEYISIKAVFQDPREVYYKNLIRDPEFKEFNDTTFIANDVIRRLSEKYLRHYVQINQPIAPDKQKAGI